MAAVYGNIYRFQFDSQNGTSTEIVIAKDGYTGEVQLRPLGSAPTLKRDNNGRIYGTSLEINAECTVPGEYAQLYTSSAYEYKVTLYRNNLIVWTGFVTPELYSEPDRPVPYDVQIVATDGLGELKFYEFYSNGMQTIRQHFTEMLQRTGVNRAIMLINALAYLDGNGDPYLPSKLLDINIDLRHENGETCYDVLQRLLTALNARITMRDNDWVIFRDTDLIRAASESYVSVYRDNDGAPRTLPVRTFGSVDTCQWWPIGNMSTVIEPARKSIELTAPFFYKETILDDNLWSTGGGASYDSTEEAYLLSGKDSYISQFYEFGDEVEYRLNLKVNARNVGSGENAQGLGVRIVIDGVSYSGEKTYWLTTSLNNERYLWSASEGNIQKDLSLPESWQTKEDAQDIEIIIPLYRSGSRSFMRAKSIDVMIFNPAGTYDIYIYDIALDRYEKPEGVEVMVNMNNGAREKASSIDLAMTDGSTVPTGARVAMCGIPMKSGVITQWRISSGEYSDYISIMSQDHAREIALPRVKYTGLLNVPNENIPFLFLRDGVFYFPRTYSLDLYYDELDVELVAIPSADVDIESSTIRTV